MTARLIALLLLLLPVQAAAQSSGRVLVMPFDNPKRDARLHWMGEAAALLLTDELEARRIDVITRAERIRALDELRIEGIKTTIPFHKKLLQHATFVDGMVDTKFVERELLG